MDKKAGKIEVLANGVVESYQLEEFDSVINELNELKKCHENKYDKFYLDIKLDHSGAWDGVPPTAELRLLGEITGENNNEK